MASKFRTTEISDPRFENNNLRFITVKTPNLKGRGDVCVFVPENSENLHDLPIVVLLHGVYGSSWVWAMKGAAHITAQTLINKNVIGPVILAMPSDGLWGDGSGYLPHYNQNFEKWIAEDVPNAIIENILQASNASNLFISGLSMGGYGALRIGAKYPQKFKGVSGHSSITSLNQISEFVEEELVYLQQKDTVNEDVFLTMLQNKSSLPAIRFDCGIDDTLIEYNRKLSQQLTENQIKHQYQEFPGKHEWIYWETHLEDTLRFFDGL